MPSWTPQITELNDQIAEAYIRAEEARKRRREAIRSWMPTIGAPEMPEERPATFVSQIMQPVEEATAAAEETAWQPQYAESIDFPERQWQAPMPQPREVPSLPVRQQPIETPIQPPREIAAWEQPAEWWKTGQELMAKGISSVPLLPQGLAVVAPAFEWIHEKVEKPIASALTTPFRPAGVGYEEWEAPTYVKGLAEMPIWWIPWIGWAGKAAKVMGVSQKAGKVAAQAVQPTGKFGTKVIWPAQEFLKSAARIDPMRLTAHSVQNVPVLKDIVRVVSGPLSFFATPGEYTYGFIKRKIADSPLNKAGLAIIADVTALERVENAAKPLARAAILAHGDTNHLNKILDMKGQDGLVKAAKPKVPNASIGADSVFKDPDNYSFVTKEADDIAHEVNRRMYGMFETAKEEGAVDAFRIGRRSISKRLSEERLADMAKQKGISIQQLKDDLADDLFEQSLTGVRHDLRQHYTTMEDGIAVGVRYSDNILDYFDENFSYWARGTARERLTRELLAIEKQGLTPVQLWDEIDNLKSTQLNQLIDQSNATKYARMAVNSLVTTKGTSLAGAVMGKVRYINPDIARRIESALTVKRESIRLIPQTLTKVAGLSPDAVRQNLRIINEVNKAFIPLGQKKTITMSEVLDAIKPLNLERQTEAALIREAYRHAIKRSAVELKAIRGDLDSSLDTLKTQIAPLKAEMQDFVRRYESTGRSGQALGEKRTVIHDIPAFRGKVFDADIAKLLETQYGPQGKSWTRQVAQASSVGRGLIANLDLSMPFIQGLYVLSRSPLQWGKLVGKQFDFLFHPNNTAKYLVQNQAVTREMALYGSSFSTFEYVQAAGLIAKGFEKIPLAGRPIASLYKRAEAAFTGGGNVARTELWKALKRPGMSQDELRELARTLDRMTGVMSLRELGISRHQQDIENAWLFFAPRYTRAGLSFVNDAFTKTGITGMEAKIALGSLMGGGTAFYIGTAKALGQQPNLDPASGRFMTLKIGDSHVGIGGMLYSLARLNSNILTAIKPDDLGLTAQNLLMPAVEGKINRDNPFVRFMLSKASPVTGTLVNVVEQKDFIGQPFESPADWARFAASRALPISVSQAMEPGMTPAAGAAGVFGLRAFPKSAWELRNEERNRIAMERFGKPYSELGKLYQHQIDETPKIKELQAEANKQTELRGGESALWLARENERESARTLYVESLNRAQMKYDAGMMTGLEFKDLLQKAGYALGQSYKQIDSERQYQGIVKKIGTGNATINEVGDAAYSALMQASYGGKFDDQFGMFDYPAYQAFRENLQGQVGPAAWEYVLAREAEHRKDLPPLAQEYYKAREALKPYWNIQVQVERLFGKAYAETPRGQALINRQKKNLRLSDATIAKYIQMFYRD